MKKKTLFSAFLLCSALTISAQSAPGDALQILMLDGAQHVVALSEVEAIDLGGGQMTLLPTDPSKEGLTLSISDVDRISFGSLSAISRPQNKDEKVVVRTDKYTLTAEGLTDGTLLEVYTTDGARMAQARAAGGRASVDAASLRPGIYIVKAGKYSLKVVKR